MIEINRPKLDTPGIPMDQVEKAFTAQNLQNRIDKATTKATADGSLTDKEMAKLNSLQAKRPGVFLDASVNETLLQASDDTVNNLP